MCLIYCHWFCVCVCVLKQRGGGSFSIIYGVMLFFNAAFIFCRKCKLKWMKNQYNLSMCFSRSSYHTLQIVNLWLPASLLPPWWPTNTHRKCKHSSVDLNDYTPRDYCSTPQHTQFTLHINTVEACFIASFIHSLPPSLSLVVFRCTDLQQLYRLVTGEFIGR